MSPIVVDKQAKQQDILAAALKVFARRGIKNVKMAEIAREAGIGKGTIYEYFRSKEEVLHAAFRHFLEAVEAEIGRRLEARQDPEQELRAFIQGSFAAAQAHDELPGLIFDIWAECIREREEDPGFDLRGMYEHYRRSLVDILERGIAQGQFRPVDPLAAAAILIAALDGLLLQWLMDRTLFDLDQMAETLADTLLQGIRQETEEL